MRSYLPQIQNKFPISEMKISLLPLLLPPLLPLLLILIAIPFSTCESCPSPIGDYNVIAHIPPGGHLYLHKECTESCNFDVRAFTEDGSLFSVLILDDENHSYWENNQSYHPYEGLSQYSVDCYSRQSYLATRFLATKSIHTIIRCENPVDTCHISLMHHGEIPLVYEILSALGFTLICCLLLAVYISILMR